jgi:holo-[acyl-carrier protein] synthase
MEIPGLPQLPPGGILVGVGIDLIEVERIRAVIERQGERFLDRVFTAEERAYAARFAAKEAVSKCFGTGIGAELGWRSVSVRHGERHQPLVHLDERGSALLRAAGATAVHLSLAHTEALAVAVAVLVRQPAAEARDGD